MQVLMYKGLSLCPLMIRDFIAGLHLSLPLYFSLFILPVSVCQVLFPGFSTQERRLCLRENLPFISEDKKKWKALCIFFSSPFLSSFYTHLCSVLHCGVSSSNSGLRAFSLSSGWEDWESSAGLMHWGLGGWDSRMEDEFSRLSS